MGAAMICRALIYVVAVIAIAIIVYAFRDLWVFIGVLYDCAKAGSQKTRSLRPVFLCQPPRRFDQIIEYLTDIHSVVGEFYLAYL